MEAKYSPISIKYALLFTFLVLFVFGKAVSSSSLIAAAYNVEYMSGDAEMNSLIDKVIFVAEARSGGSGEHELNIHEEPYAIIVKKNDVTWTNNQVYDFTLEKNNSSVQFTVGGATITANESYSGYSDIFIRVNASDFSESSSHSTTVRNINLASGKTVYASGSKSSGSVRILRIYNVTGNFTLTGELIFSWTGTMPTRSKLATQIKVVSSNASYDFGDAPSGYGDPQKQAVVGLFMGSMIDVESGTKYSAQAINDDNDENDDEDGITILDSDNNEVDISSTPLYKGRTYKVKVDVTNSTGSTAYLGGWINYNADSDTDFGDANEQIINPSSAQFASSQTQTYSFTIPASASTGNTYMRFVLSSLSSGATATSSNGNGEIEDYLATIDEDPIAISLVFFHALNAENAIKLVWQVASEINHAGYNLYRSTAYDGEYTKLNSALIYKESLSSVEEKQYEYVDTDVKQGELYYKLQDVSLDGQVTWHGPIQVTVASRVESSIGTPREFELSQNYPNPFNPATTISYALPERSQVSLAIYDLNGRLVKALVSKVQPVGNYSVVWDGTNHAGESVPSGLYFYHMSAGEFQKTERMTFLK